MRERLKHVLSPQDLALLRLIAKNARTLGMPVYLVGGLPRDVLLGRPSRDLDLVVEGDAAALACSLAAGYGGSALVHRRFGTATLEAGTARSGGEAVELRRSDHGAWTSLRRGQKSTRIRVTYRRSAQER